MQTRTLLLISAIHALISTSLLSACDAAVAAQLPSPRLSGADPAIRAPKGYKHPHPVDALPLASYKIPHPPGKKERITDPMVCKKVFFFDLENTIYLIKTVEKAKSKRMYKFCEEVLKMKDDDEIMDMILNKMESLLELMRLHKADFSDPYDFITPKPEITQLLSSMKARLWIMTNSTKDHAVMVLKKMGLYDYFEGVVYRPEGKYKYLGKSQKTLYDVAMLAADVKRPKDCYFIDDSLVNIFMARICGWKGVLYHHSMYHKPLPSTYAQYKGKISKINTLTQLPDVFPKLFTP